MTCQSGQFEPLEVAATRYDIGDASSTVRTTPRRWRWITEGVIEPPATLSGVLDGLHSVLSAAAGEGSASGGPLSGERAYGAPGAAGPPSGGGLELLWDLSDRVRSDLDVLAGSQGARTALVGVLDAADPLVVAVAECDRLLSVAARSVVDEVRPDPGGSGRVERLAVSDGGTPKASVGTVRIGTRGLSGDRQADRAHHGRPFQAVSLYSLDRFSALEEEGHPVVPGALGENVLVDGLDWSALRPGVRLSVGDEVLLELSAYAPPCNTIAPFFIDRRFDRIDHDKHPGWGRLYAWVLRGGTVAVSDEITVVP